MSARIAAFLVWALVAAGAVAWGTRLWAPPLPLPPHAGLAVAAPSAAGDWSRLFGQAPPPVQAAAAAPPPGAAERLRLLGVVAARSARAGAPGVALIAVDGKSPRALRVGAVVDEGLVVQAVLPRAVAIGPRGGPTTLRLELPALPPPASGTPGQGSALQGSSLPAPPPAPALAPPGSPALPPPPNPSAFTPHRLRQAAQPGVPVQSAPSPPTSAPTPTPQPGEEPQPASPLEARALQR